MRNLNLTAAIVVGIAAALSATPSANAQPYYGPGMMGGYGHGYMMGPGYGGSYGYGPGMMYGYGPNGERYYGRGGQRYRGKRLCWHQTNSQNNDGYYGPCPN